MTFKPKKEDLKKPVTLGLLLEYTENIIMPRFDYIDKKFDAMDKRFDDMEKKSDNKFAKLNYELKDHFDKKLHNYTEDLFRRLERKDEREKQFKAKIVSLFKKHKIGSEKDLAFLDGLVRGSL